MTPFLGQISIFPLPFVPNGWAPCNGQLLSISQNVALFALLSNTYGGDGVTTFALPDLRGCVAMHHGLTYPLGNTGGQESVMLTASQIPSHTHAVNCAEVSGTQPSPQGNFWAQDSNGNVTFSTAGAVLLAADAIGSTGEGASHDNMAPFQVLNFCIALQGIFPTQSE